MKGKPSVLVTAMVVFNVGNNDVKGDVKKKIFGVTKHQYKLILIREAYMFFVDAVFILHFCQKI